MLKILSEDYNRTHVHVSRKIAAVYRRDENGLLQIWQSTISTIEYLYKNIPEKTRRDIIFMETLVSQVLQNLEVCGSNPSGKG